MLKGLYTGYTGMINEQNRLDVISNNLANSATVGFKKEGSTSQTFKDTLTYKIKDISENPNIARHIGGNTPGVKIGECYTNYEQGSFKPTGNDTDFAISGDGFFAIEYMNKNDETSTKYTRAGTFQVNQQGFLVTEDGDYVLGSNNRRIKMNPNLSLSTTSDGTLFQDGVQVGQLLITDFEDYDYLEHFGENMYQTVEGAKNQPSTAKVMSGYVENSNVEVVKEMVDMIAVTRAYESNQKVIQTHDSALEIAANQIGKL